jgi:hypothetical protein
MGSKKQRSTSTLASELYSTIARALDKNQSVLLSSLDLSSAFDIVNTDLLIKRLRVIGLPEDVVSLIKIWLSDRTY